MPHRESWDSRREKAARPANEVLASATFFRRGWEQAFQVMAERGDDLLLENDFFSQTQWDQDEWQWSSNA
jgi:hypothetical protein